MKVKFHLLSITLLLNSMIIFLSFLRFTNASSYFRLTIFHNADMYSHFEETYDYKTNKMIGGFNRLEKILKLARKGNKDDTTPRNVLFLNGGNTFGGTYLYNMYRWRIVSKMLKLLQPDAVALGSHEFVDGLKGLEPFLEDVDFPILSANIVAKKGSIFEKKIKPSVILNISGVLIGIIGYTRKDTETKYPVGDLEFTDELESVKSECKKLTEKNINIIIALGSADLETDLVVAKEADCVDVLIGADSSIFSWNDNPNKRFEDNPSVSYPLVIYNDNGKPVPILEGFSKARYIGKIDLKFDFEGDLVEHHGDPTLLDGIVPRIGAADTVLNNFTASYEGSGNDDDVLGQVKVYLSAKKCREEECNLGNMIADSLIHYKATKYKGKYWTDTPIAILNAGSIRKSINTTKNGFNITQREISEALPFREPLITVVLEGKDLKHTLEVGARYNGETRRGEFLMVSGLKVIYDFHRPPYSRVLSVSCRCGNCKTPSYSPLVYNEYYRIITTVFLANGGDGHTIIRSASLSFVLEGVTDLVATKNYLLSHGKVRPECDDRIVHMKFLTLTSAKLNIYRRRDCLISTFIISLIYLIFS